MIAITALSTLTLACGMRASCIRLLCSCMVVARSMLDPGCARGHPGSRFGSTAEQSKNTRV